jgi:hypothetical protein
LLAAAPDLHHARLLQRADSSAAGSLPTRAFRYCEAIRMASAFGWYVFPPIRVSFMWDGGTDITWTYDGADDWYPLKTAQFPGFAEQFDAVAPDDIKGFSPPFVGALQEPRVVQIWSARQQGQYAVAARRRRKRELSESPACGRQQQLTGERRQR